MYSKISVCVHSTVQRSGTIRGGGVLLILFFIFSFHMGSFSTGYITDNNLSERKYLYNFDLKFRFVFFCFNDCMLLDITGSCKRFRFI